MQKPELAKIVKKGNSKFVQYRDGELWYVALYCGSEDLNCDRMDCGQTFSFPVPISDTGSGIFEAEMKSITLMRWIRQHLDRWDEFHKGEE